MFVTVLFGILHRETRTFDFARAGHDLPLILDASGEQHRFTLGRGHPLGLFPNPALDVQTIVIPPGGLMLMYTDGATEAMNSEYELFGGERIVNSLRERLGAGAPELCRHLLDALAAYCGDAPQSDDITLLVLRAP